MLAAHTFRAIFSGAGIVLRLITKRHPTRGDVHDSSSASCEDPVCFPVTMGLTTSQPTVWASLERGGHRTSLAGSGSTFRVSLRVPSDS